ncbi:MAG: hypothetical protein A2521_13275 [Deltaproteobacteria bacterium RIFOXYD12_FULL_57_12]|nr:MAG: hypothetical protein A2521_13275 [Deltaproteobacteria bacterium RIFOXYD12_FULL_57_12]
MKITTLRILDLWVGRPICWFLTILYKLKRFFIKKEQPENPRKILFIKLFGAGSIVLAIPTIKAARKFFPEARIFFLTFRGNEVVLTLTGLVAERDIFTVREDTLAHLIGDVSRCLRALIRERIDVVIDLEFFSRFTAILSFALRSRYRIGFYGFYTEGLKRGSFINYSINYNHTLHTSQAFFTLLKPLGITEKDYGRSLPQVPASVGYREKIENLLQGVNRLCNCQQIRKWIMLNPNTSELISLRRWPGNYYVRLAELLLEKFDDCGVIFIGSKAEAPYVNSLAAPFAGTRHAGRVIDLAGRTSIGGLLDLFHFADLFITNDSGPAHLAALTSIPIIALFGPETPELYAPLAERVECIYLGLDCQPCVTIYNGKHSYCKDNRCLQQIEPDRVFSLALSFLGGSEHDQG